MRSCFPFVFVAVPRVHFGACSFRFVLGSGADMNARSLPSRSVYEPDPRDFVVTVATAGGSESSTSSVSSGSETKGDAKSSAVLDIDGALLVFAGFAVLR